MPDLGNLSLSATLDLPRCHNLTNAPAEPSDLTGSLYPVPVKTLGNGYISDHALLFPVLQQDEAGNGNEFRVSKRGRGYLDRVKKAASDKSSDDHVKDWSDKKMDLGFCRLGSALPFLVGAPKMAECLYCHHLVYPGKELLCSVRGCERVYHMECVKEATGDLNVKKFKCPQHVMLKYNISFVIDSEAISRPMIQSSIVRWLRAHGLTISRTYKMLHNITAFLEQLGFSCAL